MNKGLILFKSIIGGVTRFIGARTELSDEYWKLMKTALALPRSLKHECLKVIAGQRCVSKKVEDRMLFNERIRVVRYHGTLLGRGWRFMSHLNMWRIMPKNVVGLRREVRLLQRMKMGQAREGNGDISNDII